MDISLKNELYKLAEQSVYSKIDQCKLELADLKESLGAESKSSAGDKHETGRAMMHLEQEKLSRQLQNYLNLKKILEQFDPEKPTKQVTFGSLVITNEICFFVLGAMGQFNLRDKNYYFVSMNSDIAQAFKGRKEGDLIEFKAKKYRIDQLL